MAPALSASALAFLPVVLSDSATILVYSLQIFPALRSSHNAIFSTGIHFFSIFIRMSFAHPSGPCLNVISSEKSSLNFPIQILSACKELPSHSNFIADIAIVNYVFICLISLLHSGLVYFVLRCLP